jgi:hypothetical protein
MKKLAIDKSVEDRPEGPQANAGTPEEIILVPEREADSFAHIASPRLADPKKARDFEQQVIEDITDVSG